MIVELAVLVFALVVVVVALSFVRWALRTVSRKDAELARLRYESLERYGALIGKNIDATPRERKAELEQERHVLERDYRHVGLIADPEQTVEFPSPSEARMHEKLIGAQIGELEFAHNGYHDREPLFVDIGEDAAR